MFQQEKACDKHTSRVIASVFIGNVRSRVLIFDYVFVLLVRLRVYVFLAYLPSNRKEIYGALISFSDFVATMKCLSPVLLFGKKRKERRNLIGTLC